MHEHLYNLNKREQAFSQHLFLLVDVGRGQHGRRERFLAWHMHCRLLNCLLLLHDGCVLRRISHIRRVLVRLRVHGYPASRCRRVRRYGQHRRRNLLRQASRHRRRVHRSRTDRCSETLRGHWRRYASRSRSELCLHACVIWNRNENQLWCEESYSWKRRMQRQTIGALGFTSIIHTRRPFVILTSVFFEIEAILKIIKSV